MNAPEVGEGKVVCLLRVALHYNIYIYIYVHRQMDRTR